MSGQTATHGLEGSATWSQWRATVARFHRLWQAARYRLGWNAARSMRIPFVSHVSVPCSQVLLVVLEHELWKHPQRHPGDDVLTAARGNEVALSTLLAKAGWPRWRIRRIRSLQWSIAQVALTDLSNLPLTPMSWVFQLGAGSNRAEDVARGAVTALARGRPVNMHIAAIRTARELPPRPRAVVTRQSRNEYIVEDGNHFVVALLLSGRSTESAAIKVPVYLGTRARRRIRGV